MSNMYTDVQISPGEIIHRIWYAKHFLDSLYKENTTNAYIAEYPGLPLSIVVPNDGYSPRLAGFYAHNTLWGTFQWMKTTPKGQRDIDYDSDAAEYRFEDAAPGLLGALNADHNEPKLEVTRRYYPDGTMKYEVKLLEFDGTGQVDLYLGDQKLATIDQYTQVGTTWTVWGPKKWHSLPSHRYTIRHGTRMGYHVARIWNETSKATKLNQSRIDEGYPDWDLYDPIYRVNTGQDINKFYSLDSYYDVYKDINHGVNALSHGLNPHRYGYESKMTMNRWLRLFLASGGQVSASAYMEFSKHDYLVPVLQAIHVLNRFGDPDYSYIDPKYRIGSYPNWTTVSPSQNKTPALIARWLEAEAWNGFGIHMPQRVFAIPAAIVMKPVEMAVSVRTAVFLVLETLLGYKYDDQTSRAWADKVANQYWQTQWGVHYPGARVTGEHSTIKWGLHRRPNWMGASMNSTARGKNYAQEWWHPGSMPELWEFEPWNMPLEDVGAQYGPAEATFAFQQAYRVYLHYAYGIDCPTSSLIP